MVIFNKDQIPFAVFFGFVHQSVAEIKGSFPSRPQMSVSCQKGQIPLTVKIHKNNFRSTILIEFYCNNKLDNNNDKILPRYL